MSLKVLVIEDMEVLYKYVMRLFEKTLSIENFEFTNVQTIPLALEALEQDWDVILMDYYLGALHGERGEASFRNGADLVAYRRALEEAEPEKKKARIIGFSGSVVCNDHMASVGATCSFLKDDVPGIAEMLEGWYKETNVETA